MIDCRSRFVLGMPIPFCTTASFWRLISIPVKDPEWVGMLEQNIGPAKKWRFDWDWKIAGDKMLSPPLALVSILAILILFLLSDFRTLAFFIEFPFLWN